MANHPHHAGLQKSRTHWRTEMFLVELPRSRRWVSLRQNLSSTAAERISSSGYRTTGQRARPNAQAWSSHSARGRGWSLLKASTLIFGLAGVVHLSTSFAFWLLPSFYHAAVLIVAILLVLKFFTLTQKSVSSIFIPQLPGLSSHSQLFFFGIYSYFLYKFYTGSTHTDGFFTQRPSLQSDESAASAHSIPTLLKQWAKTSAPLPVEKVNRLVLAYKILTQLGLERSSSVRSSFSNDASLVSTALRISALPLPLASVRSQRLVTLYLFNSNAALFPTVTSFLAQQPVVTGLHLYAWHAAHASNAATVAAVWAPDRLQALLAPTLVTAGVSSLESLHKGDLAYLPSQSLLAEVLAQPAHPLLNSLPPRLSILVQNPKLSIHRYDLVQALSLSYVRWHSAPITHKWHRRRVRSLAHRGKLGRLNTKK